MSKSDFPVISERSMDGPEPPDADAGAPDVNGSLKRNRDRWFPTLRRLGNASKLWPEVGGPARAAELDSGPNCWGCWLVWMERGGKPELDNRNEPSMDDKPTPEVAVLAAIDPSYSARMAPSDAPKIALPSSMRAAVAAVVADLNQACTLWSSDTSTDSTSSYTNRKIAAASRGEISNGTLLRTIWPNWPF